MLFHTWTYLLIFLPSVFFLYFFVIKKIKIPFEYLLIGAGIFFYAAWNIYLTPLILFSIICNYYLGNLIREQTDSIKKKRILFFSVFFNIALLIVFKYSDFVILNLNYIFKSNIDLLYLPFPLAISFFTFQTIAYLVDCYDGNIIKNKLTQYSVFIIFFPQLIAGPIVRYNHMMNQFNDVDGRKINFNNINIGLIVILIGLLKKIILSDNLSIYVNEGFTNSDGLTFIDGWLTSLCFTFQFYFDFSGYVEMATGTALLFNIRLPQNFNSPFKANNIINFWQRWHMTLTSFLTNYIYYPWMRSYKEISFTKGMYVTFMLFLIAGLWHGASWLFVVFGALHGIGLVINHIFRKFVNLKFNKIMSIFITFNYVNFTFIFFRSEDLNTALNIVKSMIGLNGFYFLDLSKDLVYSILILIISISICFFFRNTNYLIENFKPLKKKETN